MLIILPCYLGCRPASSPIYLDKIYVGLLYGQRLVRGSALSRRMRIVVAGHCSRGVKINFRSISPTASALSQGRGEASASTT